MRGQYLFRIVVATGFCALAALVTSGWQRWLAIAVGLTGLVVGLVHLLWPGPAAEVVSGVVRINRLTRRGAPFSVLVIPLENLNAISMERRIDSPVHRLGLLRVSPDSIRAHDVIQFDYRENGSPQMVRIQARRETGQRFIEAINSMQDPPLTSTS
jgi:hypothetical protein